MTLKKIAVFLVLLLILVFAFWIRSKAFWLPHWQGEQKHYVVLAMKLDKVGFGSGYNLRGTDLGNSILPENPPIELTYCRPALEALKGNFVQTLKMAGHSYYDEPLYYNPPLFPYLLMASHKLFANQALFYGVCTSNLGEKVRSVKPKIIFQAQFWAVIVPLFFNLGVIIMTFLFGVRFFNEKIGLWASFLMAVNPVSIFLAHRVGPEDMLTFFMALSLFLYLIFLQKKNYLGIAAAGFSGALAILTKQTGILLLVVILIVTYFEKSRGGKKISNWIPSEFLVFFLVALTVSGFWFVKVWQTFGNPFHQPFSLSLAMKQDTTGWFNTVSHRPPPLLFFSFGVFFLMPVFSFALLMFRRFYRQCTGILTPLDNRAAKVEAVFWIWILVFYFYFAEPWHVLELSANQEHQFFYMVYPAIGVLSALGLESARARWSKMINSDLVADLAVTGLLFLSGWWGISLAMKPLFQNVLVF